MNWIIITTENFNIENFPVFNQLLKNFYLKLQLLSLELY